jgi:ABC-type proline/glycine betaine transport system ATPase subunit
VLLLDEPFGALDAKVRKELRRWLRRLHDDMQLTSIFVTHDQEEALELALLANGDMLEAEIPHGSPAGELIAPDKLVTLTMAKVRAFPDAAAA